ncbi:MAG: NADH-quinone oxidoreductase subunit C [Opitutaceae bacterium]|jgi:NADH-quinone oxidoreductase subunit C|nr:NADH-quinone oxidoreductase subunit C [Opitutaceae bacterium]
METPGQIRDRILARFSGAEVTVVTNPGPAAQHSLLVGAAHATAIATFLRDDPVLRLDTCSNVTGVDWPGREIVETVRQPLAPEEDADPAAPPGVIEEKIKRLVPGSLEVVYHLYSVALKHGPVILRLRTADRAANVTLPSLTPVWRACEFQEREVFDLYGVKFTGHPDLRRILMWDEFQHHPMRKDYVEPDDYEWEPTPHDAVLTKARRHYPAPPAAPEEESTP